MLVDCPDDVGLIRRITSPLESRRLNIEANHEFVDATAGHFFFRAEVAPAATPVPTEALRSRPRGRAAHRGQNPRDPR